MFRKAIPSAIALAILSSSAFAAVPARTSLNEQLSEPHPVVEQGERFEVAEADERRNRRVEIKRKP